MTAGAENQGPPPAAETAAHDWLAAVSEGVFVADAGGLMVYANQRLAEMSQRPVAQLVGRNVDELVPPRSRVKHAALRHDFGREPGPRSLGHRPDLRLLRADGSELAVEIGLSPVGRDGMVVGVVSDIDERQRAAEAQAALVAQLQAALDEVRTLRGLVPICAWCKKIRDEDGAWQDIEDYVRRHTEAEWTHCICPECFAAQTKDLA
jgi:PAS domain S-box-containing protein